MIKEYPFKGKILSIPPQIQAFLLGGLFMVLLTVALILIGLFYKGET